MSWRGAVLVLALLAPGVAEAQILSGRILDQESGNPIEGALIQLLAPDSTRVASVLSGAGGGYAIRIAEDVPYRVRVQRIGFATVVTGPVDRARASQAPFDIELSVQAIELDPLLATGSGRCVVDPRTGAETAVLWDQARRVLEVTALVQRDELLQFEAVRFRRDLDPDRTVLRAESLEASELRRPFRSPPADSLMEFGFVQTGPGESRYFLPDPEATLSDAFLDGHCFHVAVQQGPRGRLVGLAFEPIRDGGPPDVAGVLWLDGRTGELQYMEYSYTGILEEAEGFAGGRAEFEQLGTGAWAVRRWHISMPVIGERSRLLGLSRERFVMSLREEGGEIREAYDASGAAVTRPGPFGLEGRVFDLDDGRPLAGASVYLSGTGRVHVADDDGNFEFPSLPAGEYLVTFSHPLLDTMVVFPPVQQVRLPDQEEPLLLLSPSRAETRRDVCPEMRENAVMGVLSGAVVDEAGRPVQDAQVRLRLMTAARSRGEATVATDERGLYRFCGVPSGSPVSVSASDGERRSEESLVTPRPGRFSRVDISLPGGGSG